MRPRRRRRRPRGRRDLRRSPRASRRADAGFELGNHTYSHRSLNRLPLEEFEQDVVRGETVTRRLLAEKGRTLRYFRHPFLQVGLDLPKRRAFEAFLAARNYTVAPVTIDNDDQAYRRPDDYVGAWGISWLHHWELTAGRPRPPSPDPPDWVSKAYEAASHGEAR